MSIQTRYSKVQALAEIIKQKTSEITASSEDEYLYKTVVSTFYVKGWKTCQGIFLLSINKLANDAFILVRSLFEIVVILYFIKEDPLRRARLYLEHDIVQKKRYADKLRGMNDPWIQKIFVDVPLDVQDELVREYDRVKDNYPGDKRHWAGLNLFDMAERTGLGAHYATVYWLFSNLAHTNPRAIDHYVTETERGLLLGPDPTASDIDRVTVTAVFYLLMIIEVKNGVFNLGLEHQIEELKADLTSTGIDSND